MRNAFPRRRPITTSHLSAIVMLIASVGCDADESRLGTSPSLSAPNARVVDAIPGRGRGQEGKGSESLTDAELWRDIADGGGSAVVGLKRPERSRGSYRGQNLISRPEWMSAGRALERAGNITVLEVDSLLPMMLVRVKSGAALAQLRRHPMVDYVEANQLKELTPLTFGCSESANNLPTVPLAQTAGSGIDAMSSPFPRMLIDRAWEYSTGDGVSVGLVDTGIPSSSAELFTRFSTGMSAGRTLRHFSNGGNPGCSHGARMAGLIAAPRNGEGAIGVAWRSNLLSSSAITSVWTGAVNELWNGNGITAWNIARGIRAVADNGARVIAMAFGQQMYSETIAAEIFFQKAGRDVFFVAAAGTCASLLCSLPQPTLFPARMSEVFAASGTDWNGGLPRDITSVDKVNAVAMIPLTTTRAGGPGLSTFSGSSAGTAVLAGVAALVRSRYPMWSSDMVRDRIISTKGSLCGLTPSWTDGLVNAEAAVGGICPFMSGTAEVIFDRQQFDPRPSQSVNITASVRGGDGTLRIRWNDGQIVDGVGTSTRSFSFPRGNYINYITAEFQDLSKNLPPRRLVYQVRVIDLETDTTCPTCF